MEARHATWLLASAGLLTVVAFATAHRETPRCPDGMTAVGARCCGEGQRLEAGRCVGTPTRCAAGLERHADACVAPRRKVRIGAGESSWRPPDTTLATAGETAKTGAFELDAYEVTWDAWKACVAAGRCVSLPAGDPGQAVFGVTRDEARAYCKSASGRLPTDAEWLRAAIGPEEKRYPWGDPDAFCLRAAFALKDGRCAWGGSGPDTVGARPWGATPTGLFDVAGNVAEWVDDGAPPGEGAVRGSSWAESDATTLRPRWRKVVAETARLPWIGFRCAYDAP